MDLDELQALVSIANSGSFASAAREACVPRSTLRRRIDSLEARVGVPLVERSAHGVRLTDAGALLVQGANEMLDDAKALIASVRERQGAPTTRLNIGLPAGPPATPMVELILSEPVYGSSTRALRSASYSR